MASNHDSPDFYLLSNWAYRCEPPVPSSHIFYSVLFYSISILLKMMIIAGQWWLTPVILATQKAEIRRITV
jgi:hypothetical protein